MAGAQAYAAGKYTDAVRSFEQAYALAPRPTVLFSLAQAERKSFLEHADPIALRHAIGQSGSRLLTTMLYEMKRRDVRRGLAALCLGGGNAVALAVER